MTGSKKDLVSMFDMSKGEILGLIDLAIDMKNNRYTEKPLDGKTLGMIFSKSSTRTRVSFEVGAYQLGGQALFLSTSDIQLGRGEPISDTAKVLSRYVDGIMIRTFSHLDVEELAHYATIPVINGLTDDEHPCQILADLMTVYEHKKTYDVKIGYVGDGNNVAASLAIACEIMGIECVIASPNGYTVAPEIQEKTPSVTYTDDVRAAAKGADVIYTDVWASMGQERERTKRLLDLQAFQVNDTLTSLCNEYYLFLHCLPAHRGEEVTPEIIEGEHSVVFDEAENRLHAQKAVMATLMGGGIK